MVRYQKVLWHHDHPDEPVALYGEIDAGFEVRKVEAGGRLPGRGAAVVRSPAMRTSSDLQWWCRF